MGTPFFKLFKTGRQQIGVRHNLHADIREIAPISGIKEKYPVRCLPIEGPRCLKWEKNMSCLAFEPRAFWKQRRTTSEPCSPFEKEKSGLSWNLNLGQLGKRERYLCAVLCYCPLSHPFSAVAKYLILEIVLEDQKHAGAERQKQSNFNPIFWQPDPKLRTSIDEQEDLMRIFLEIRRMAQLFIRDQYCHLGLMAPH